MIIKFYTVMEKHTFNIPFDYNGDNEEWLIHLGIRMLTGRKDRIRFDFRVDKSFCGNCEWDVTGKESFRIIPITALSGQLIECDSSNLTTAQDVEITHISISPFMSRV